MLRSPPDRLLKLARSLHTRKGRERSGLFLVEGARAIETMLVSGAALEQALVSEPEAPLTRKLMAAGVAVELADAAVLASVSAQVTPAGCLALVRRPAREVGELLPERLLVLDEVRDPGNVGTVLRTADAVGAGVMLCDGCADPLSPKVVRATAGSVVKVAWYQVTGDQARRRLDQDGRGVVVLDAGAEQTLYDAPLPHPIAVVVGNEAHGPSAAWLACGEGRRVPMQAGVESLNVAAAAAVAAYESVRQYGLKAGVEGAQ